MSAFGSVCEEKLFVYKCMSTFYLLFVCACVNECLTTDAHYKISRVCNPEQAVRYKFKCFLFLLDLKLWPEWKNSSE